MKNNIELGEEQIQAIELVKQFLKSTESVFCIKGPAGVGKSLIESYIIDYLKEQRINYCLAAPTHKAALVMEQYIGEKAMTLHSLLALSPKLDILNLDFNDLGFYSGVCVEIPNNGIVICDEASMINDDLYKFLIERCEDNNSKILFILDPKQIQPVKQKNYSKVCHIKNSIELTKIYRQNQKSALLPILSTLRDRPIYHFDTSVGDDGSVVCIENINNFAEKFISEFKTGIKNSNVLHTKILAYTNNRVNKYNEIVHKLIFNDDKEYHKFGFLTCCENIEKNKMKFWNSMDYIIVDNPKELEINIPKFGKLPGHKLKLYDSLTGQTENIKILSKNISSDVFEALAAFIEEQRINAINCNSKYKKFLWKEYFKIIESFCTPVNLYFDERLIRKRSFDHGYACTVHRSQGSSIDTVFVDIKDIFKQKNSEELRQLQYVALSRARKDVYIYQ